jgi:hypothetical protein
VCHSSSVKRLIVLECLDLDIEIVSVPLSLTSKYFRFRRRRTKFGAAGAQFSVGRCSTRLEVLENLGIAAGIASLSCIEPEL